MNEKEVRGVDACLAFAPEARKGMPDVCRLPGTSRTSAPCGRQGAVEGNFDVSHLSNAEVQHGVPREMSGGPCSADRFRAPARLAVEP